MSFIKNVLVFGLALVFVSNAPSSSLDIGSFTAMDIRATMMNYYSGTARVVSMLMPSFLTEDEEIEATTAAPVKESGWGFFTFFKPVTKTVKHTLRVITKTISTTIKGIFTFTLDRLYPKRSKPSNMFFEAVSAVERGGAEAKAAQRWLRYSDKKIQTLKITITMAAQNRMFQYSRYRLGEALFLIKEHESSRPRRSTDSEASTFVNDLKESMGATKFDEFMAVMGDVTLMFAIDTTGSMSDEIDTAKRIAVEVINYPRKNPVNYILSPFNDPKTGPVTFRESTEGALFVEDINNLVANGGGDCAELTFRGILDALDEGPDSGSPMYVFTDASAKDATPSNIEAVKTMTEYLGITINFFTTSKCGKSDTDDVFIQVAEATSGEMLRLSGTDELKKLSGLTGSVLGGASIISSGSSLSTRRKRRAARVTASYSIKIDDSVEKISVCITTENSDKGREISLVDPRGVAFTAGNLSLSKVSVYEISRPTVGNWLLTIPPSAGIHRYMVRSTSETNINFQHLFMVTLRRPRSEVPTSRPLMSQNTKLILTLSGADKVRKVTVVLELITKYGEHIQDTLLTHGEGDRYTANFTSPTRPFKLKIKGTTKSGNPFERISRSIVEPTSILLRALRSDQDYTLRRGKTSSVIFHIYNSGDVRKVVKINVKDRLKYATKLRRSKRPIRGKRSIFVTVFFVTPPSATIGAGNTVIMTVSVANEAEIISKPVQLIVVE